MGNVRVLPLLLGVALIASFMVAQAEPAAPPEEQPGVPSDQPPVMTAGQIQARDLWTSLTDADKKFVREFISKNDLALFAPQMLSLRARGRNEEALKILAKYYELNDPVRAEIILKLLAYAHDQQ